MKIIVVDDEPDVQFLFKQRFRREIRKEEIEFNFFLKDNVCLVRISRTAGAITLLLVDYIF